MRTPAARPIFATCYDVGPSAKRFERIGVTFGRRRRAFLFDLNELSVMHPLTALALFVATAVAEIVGCYLPYLWLRRDGSAWLLLPAAASLALFVYLLTLHPHAAGRVYAAYGGVYIATALLWLWTVDGVRPDRWDLAGVAVSLLGMMITYFAPRT